MRLLEEAFNQDIERTQGIAIQAVKVKENVWRKEFIKAVNVQKVFNKGVLEEHKQSKDKNAVSSTRLTEGPEDINEGNVSSEDEENSVTDEQAETEKESQWERPRGNEQYSKKEEKSGNEEQPNEELEEQPGNGEPPENLEQPGIEEQSEREHQIDDRNQQTVGPQLDTSNIKQLTELLGQESTDDEEEEYIIFGWDYGGHAEYYATHQLFTKGEAVHLIVMDITKPFNEHVEYDDVNVTKSTPTTPAQFLCYWLNSIDKESKAKNVTPSVAIFLTHIDKIKKIDEKRCRKCVDDYKVNIHNEIKGKPYENLITLEDIFEIDNTSTDDHHFDSAKRHIFQMITQQSTWGQERPLQWLKLEADIRRKHENESVKHMEISKVKELATNHGMTKMDVKTFLDFHHVMGEFVHFPEKNLEDLVVIDAQWLVDKLKVLIAPQKLLKENKVCDNILKQLEQGKIEEKNLEELWKGEKKHFLFERTREEV